MIHQAVALGLAAIATLLVGCDPGADAQTPAAVPAAPLPRVSFPASAVHEVPSASGRRYQVWVDLPAAYAQDSKRYPVVFVTDPNFAFATTRTVRDFAGQRGRNIESFILVGLVHDPDVTPAQSRGRDYTPTDPRKNPKVNPARYSGDRYGEAEAYRDYVETRVLPLIARSYRADMSRKTFVGHSYGSVFGLYTLFTRPGMFQNYVLGSPSLWFDDHLLLKMEAEYARTHKDLPARIHMVAGSFESFGPTERHYKDNDLAGTMQRFAATLQQRKYPSLTVSSEVADGEDHYTVFHDVASRGLLRLLPGHGPYTSG